MDQGSAEDPVDIERAVIGSDFLVSDSVPHCGAVAAVPAEVETVEPPHRTHGEHRAAIKG